MTQNHQIAASVREQPQMRLGFGEDEQSFNLRHGR